MKEMDGGADCNNNQLCSDVENPIVRNTRTILGTKMNRVIALVAAETKESHLDLVKRKREPFFIWKERGVWRLASRKTSRETEGVRRDN